MKVKVYGGCVSRDILNFDEAETMQLVSYNARSSLATLGSNNVAKTIPNKYYESLSNISSKFQRRMVESDFNNEIIESAAAEDYDVLLIDFLVDRFHLAEINGKLVTRSVEFVRSGIKPDKLINTFSDQYMKLWREGIDNLFSVVDHKIGLDAIKINKVYWSNQANTPEDTILLNDKWEIEKNNEKLKAMYDYVEQILPSSSIIEVDKDLLVADSNHKWGLSPFHFTDDYYKRMLEKMRT
ncbi:DUF6270 domain-containing protein [Psychrobacter sp. FME5]|uniref:DUF6270 domain-containing protein n=1 Tax=Psychrobacter sp. FME5 TaxID=2487706 RepID=UPI0017881A77|nr:DUF6270 domain-containing protein [Psychrobacter sp. FME5]MBE0444162.1 hypothetical protein [Psychrobacter sp. FME5]